MDDFRPAGDFEMDSWATSDEFRMSYWDWMKLFGYTGE
jgi:hypothetical protein